MAQQTRSLGYEESINLKAQQMSILLLGWGLIIGRANSLFLGLAVSDQQGSAVDDVANHITAVSTWVNEAEASIVDTKAEVDKLEGKTKALTDTIEGPECSGDPDLKKLQEYVGDFSSITSKYSAETANIDSDATQPLVEVNEKVGDINKQITDFNKLRKQAVEATLALCLVFLIIQIGINAADVFCKSGSKPNQTTICGFCVTPTITLLFCVFLFLLFILAFVLHIVAATVADVRGASRSISPRWGSIRFRRAPRTYAPCGPSVRAVSQTESRKIPTQKTLPLFHAAAIRCCRARLTDS